MTYTDLTDRTKRTDAFIAGLGFPAYRVGGSVRDAVIGRKAKDNDYVVTGASLDELALALAAAQLDQKIDKFAVKPLVTRDRTQVGWRVSGRGFGLVEIVLPRVERSTGPGHGDFKIEVDPHLSLADDAKRRDFTFNALYLDLGTEMVCDATGRGMNDIWHRFVNVTHADSFRDDPLRILRALRFVSVLDYDLGPDTRALMAAQSQAVTGLTRDGVSGTVYEELSKLLMGRNPAKALRLARDTGVLAVVLPELASMLGFDQGSRYHDLTTDEHTFKALETAAHVDAPLRVRWALLFHDSGKPEVVWVGKDGRNHYYAHKDRPFSLDHEDAGVRLWENAAGRLSGLPRGLRKDVSVLIQNHMVSLNKPKATKVARERVRLGDDLLRDLYMMRACDVSAKGKSDKQMIENVAQLERLRGAFQAAKHPTSIKDLEVNGADVLILGVTGSDIGRVLAAVLDEVVVGMSWQKLTRQWQLERVWALA